MNITTALTNPTTYLILALLCLTCIAYAFAYVRPTRRRDPDHGQTALFVIIGNTIVGLAYTIGLAATFGLQIALSAGALLLIYFAVAGLPMVVEYIDDHTTRRQSTTAPLTLLNTIKTREE